MVKSGVTSAINKLVCLFSQLDTGIREMSDKTIKLINK